MMSWQRWKGNKIAWIEWKLHYLFARTCGVVGSAKFCCVAAYLLFISLLNTLVVSNSFLTVFTFKMIAVGVLYYWCFGASNHELLAVGTSLWGMQLWTDLCIVRIRTQVLSPFILISVKKRYADNENVEWQFRCIKEHSALKKHVCSSVPQ